jgi:hypothetical protein
MRARGADRWLRWYPAAWRERYGEELSALVEDTYGPDARVPRRARLRLARAGIGERFCELAGGHDPDPGDRSRAGVLLVLCGWACFVAAGSAVAKFAEHWDSMTPRTARSLPTASFDALQWAAAVGAVLVLVGIAATAPTVVRTLRRKGGAGGTGGAVFTVGTGGTWALVRRLPLPPGVGRLLGALGVMLTMVMTVVLVTTVLWWAALAGDGSRLLSGSRNGLFSTSPVLTMTLSALLMVVGLAIACGGSRLVVTAGARRAHP